MLNGDGRLHWRERDYKSNIRYNLYIRYWTGHVVRADESRAMKIYEEFQQGEGHDNGKDLPQLGQIP